MNLDYTYKYFTKKLRKKELLLLFFGSKQESITYTYLEPLVIVWPPCNQPNLCQCTQVCEPCKLAHITTPSFEFHTIFIHTKYGNHLAEMVKYCHAIFFTPRKNGIFSRYGRYTWKYVVYMYHSFFYYMNAISIHIKIYLHQK